jgi:AcrR family transcriptional regulator
MARRKDQEARRNEVTAAATRAIARMGAEGVRVSDVADEAGLSPATVMYYFPTRRELMAAAFTRAIERFHDRRRLAIAGLEDPVAKLVEMIRNGFPTGPDDEEVLILYLALPVVRADPDVAALLMRLTRSQVEDYIWILEDGAARGVFALGAEAAVIADHIVALEDAYGLYIESTGFPYEEAVRSTLRYAQMAVGRDLPGA